MANTIIKILGRIKEASKPKTSVKGPVPVCSPVENDLYTTHLNEAQKHLDELKGYLLLIRKAPTSKFPIDVQTLFKLVEEKYLTAMIAFNKAENNATQPVEYVRTQRQSLFRIGFYASQEAQKFKIDTEKTIPKLSRLFSPRFAEVVEEFTADTLTANTFVSRSFDSNSSGSNHTMIIR